MTNLNKKGFTLIELIVTVVILGIISIMAIPQVTKIQNDNKLTKYKTYADSLEAAAKLYTDSYSKDMFGNNTSGCYKITYNELKNKRLIQDIKVDGASCGYDETFVMVYKTNDNYTYDTSILCKDKNGNKSYEFVVSDTCSLEADTTPPTITLDPNAHSDAFSDSDNKKVAIKIYDEYGMLENAKVSYAWFDSATNIMVSDAWTEVSFKNKRQTKETSATIKVDVAVVQKGLTGTYHMKVVPIHVRDINGNYKTGEISSGDFNIDNTDTSPPECGTVSGASAIWTNNSRTITVECSDAESGCPQAQYSQTFDSGTIKTDKITIYNNAGKTKDCSVNVYVDKESPTAPTIGSIGSVSGSSTTGTIKTAASGSSDGSGSGIKEYRYLVTNSSSTPTDKTLFTTSKNFTRSCGKAYYAWAIAVDEVGNISDIKSLGTTSDGANSYSSWRSCNCTTKQQTRTNTCDLVTTGLTQDCSSSCFSCSWAGTDVFGSYKGAISGNYGAWQSAGASWGNWCHADGTTCNASGGYVRYCIKDECKGMTADEVNDTYGCDYAPLWCDCG